MAAMTDEHMPRNPLPCLHRNLCVEIGQTVETYCVDCGAPFTVPVGTEPVKASLRVIEGGKQ